MQFITFKHAVYIEHALIHYHMKAEFFSQTMIIIIAVGYMVIFRVYYYSYSSLKLKDSVQQTSCTLDILL